MSVKKLEDVVGAWLRGMFIRGMEDIYILVVVSSNRRADVSSAQVRRWSTLAIYCNAATETPPSHGNVSIGLSAQRWLDVDETLKQEQSQSLMLSETFGKFILVDIIPLAILIQHK